jgi:glycosyltransferase involved in cell wall biosynthesis
LSPVKRLEVLVDAAVRLREMNRLEDFSFILVGRPSTPEQRPYAESIRQRVAEQGLDQVFEFRGAAPYVQVASFYREADLFVSMQEQRGLDKAVLEAMSSGLPVVTANESFRPLMGRWTDRLMYPPAEPDALADRLVDLARWPAAERRALGLELRERVQSGHGLDRLMDLIVNEAARLRA